MNISANPLARKKAAGYYEAIESIKAAARSALGLPEDVVISVTELNCREPVCGGTETVVAVFKAGGKPQVFRFHKPIIAISTIELDGAFGAR